MTLSIIIVSWNTAKLIADCLHSIYAHPPDIPYDIWVVDNNSTDDSVAMLRAEFPAVKLLTNAENVGFAAANNQAIRQSESDYVLLLNPDTVVKAKALTTLYRFMEETPTAGAVGPRTLNPDDSLQQSAYHEPTLTGEIWRLFHLDKLYPYQTYQMQKWQSDQPRRVDTLLGACLLLRRAALAEVGLLDETYFMYSEEIDLCTRLRRAGWPLYWLPTAEIVHYGGQSTKQVAAPMFLRLYQAKLLYFRKHHGCLAGALYKFILLLAALARLALSPLLWLQPPQQRQEQLTLARHYQRLVATLPRM